MGCYPSPQPSSPYPSESPEGTPLTELPQIEMLPFWSPPKILSEQLHRFPSGPLKREMPVSGIFFYTFPSKARVIALPPPCSPSGSPWRERSFISRASGEFIHLYLLGFPIRSPPTIRGKYLVTIHGAPRRRKAYIQWGAAWFPKGIV